MGNTIGYVVKCEGSYWQNVDPCRGQWGGRVSAAVFPTKESASVSFTRPGYYPGRLDGVFFKVVRLTQKAVEGTGRFVVRWRNRDGRLENYLNCDGRWGGFSDAVIHMTWDEAEDAIAEHGGITWSDMELPGPAIIKLKARRRKLLWE
jgi:hypothetical protein